TKSKTMKQVLVVLLLIAGIAVNAQSDKYADAMQKNLDMLKDAKTVAALQNVSASFQRVADAEKTQWLPYYYAALAQAWIGYMDQSADKDALANNARTILEKSEALETNAETYCVRYMLANIQMAVDPQTRWQTYGMQSTEALQKAEELDASNPRVYYLKGTNTFYTPEQFGGGKAKAKPILEKSVEMFKTFEAKPMYPNWGKEDAEKMLAQCQ
ncbi:MAG: hypothetical protein ABJA79_07125, partial [Parafilimonas sp.]